MCLEVNYWAGLVRAELTLALWLTLTTLVLWLTLALWQGQRALWLFTHGASNGPHGDELFERVYGNLVTFL